jgi:hypothetical protein
MLLYLLDEAFDGNEEHSLLGNLRSVEAGDWHWLPPDGRRSIRDIVAHTGACKYMYENLAFGDARLTWTDPLVEPALLRADPVPVPEVLAWLREGHGRLRESLAALDDAALIEKRGTSWGTPAETRWLISVMIEHDLYHAGEINHLRALHHQSDRWAYES